MEKHIILEKAENNHLSKCSINKEGVEKTLMYQQEEFERNRELGRIMDKYMNKNNIVQAALTRVQVEAFEIDETHGKKLNLGEITWRGW